MIGQAGVYWPFKTLLQGAGISLVETATSITVVNTGSGGPSSGDMTKTEYATNGVHGIVDRALTADSVTGSVSHATLADTVPWTGITGLPSGFVPSPHAPTHLPGGSDVINPAGTVNGGLLNRLSGLITDFVDGTNACQDLATAARPVIYSVRLRTWNALGNPNFDVNQMAVGYAAAPPPSTSITRIVDRWWYSASTGINAHISTGQVDQHVTGPCLLPGTNFRLSARSLQIGLTAQQTLALGSADSVLYRQRIEGICVRALMSDVTSLSLLAWTNILGGLRFGVSILDYNTGTAVGTTTYCLPKLCVIPTPNTWTLIQFPNLPVPPSGFVGSIVDGAIGARLFISLACGSAGIAPTADVWQSTATPTGAYVAPPGSDNFLTKPVGSLLVLGYIKWEPGPICTALTDVPFDQSLYACKRYYQKSVPYNAVPAPSVATATERGHVAGTTTTIRANYRWEREMAAYPAVRVWWDALNKVYVDFVGPAPVTPSTVSGDTKQLGDMTLVTAAPSYASSAPVLFECDADTGM